MLLWPGHGSVQGAPPPPAPVLPNFTAAVAVDFGAALGPVRVEPSVQVVSQHLLFRDSPIHDASFATLQQLGARNVRFVPWVPYAIAGVAELMPPSFPHVCGPQNWIGGQEGIPAAIDCGPGGGKIVSIDFASYGTPGGNCGAYAVGACHAPNASAVVSALCVGQSSCSVPTANGGIFGTPCSGDTWLAVQATCETPVLHTYWNFSAPDALFTDFWEAVDGNSSEPIPNCEQRHLRALLPPFFRCGLTHCPSPPPARPVSTQPTWLYSTDYNWRSNPDAPSDYTRGPAASVNNTLLGEYYGRLYGYFLNGFMVDEAGTTHTRPGGPLNLTTIELFNEVDYEHGYSVEQYTASFDAVVAGVRAAAGPERRIKFVGLNLPNIDSGQKVAQWASYFLNASNHAAEGGTALDYLGYHAYPTNGPYTKDPDSFALLFDYVDDYIANHVKAIDAVIAALSPSTRTVLDESGTDMDGVLGPGSPPQNNPRYWVAAAGYWAYLYMRSANESSTVVQCGASQLMDAPGQEPSVTLLDWASGQGTARFWVVRLLVETVDVGATLRHATSAVSAGANSTSAVYAMGLSAVKGGGSAVLLINKRNAWATIALSCGAQACACASQRVIDEANGLLPARQAPCDTPNSVTLAPYATVIATLSF